MAKISVSTNVGVDAQTAFNYLADLTKHAEWANPKSGLQVSHVSGSGVGAKYSSSQKFLGKGNGAEITVTAFEPPRALAFDAVEHGKRFQHSFTITAGGSGVTITRDIEAPLPPVVSLIAKPAIRKEAQAGLESLKAKLAARS